MRNLKMPEPVAYALGDAKYTHTSNIFAAHEFVPDGEHADEWSALYTANALRDVLEQAAVIAERAPCFSDDSAERIRALIKEVK